MATRQRRNDARLAEVEAEVVTANAMATLYQERLAELELALEDVGWNRIGSEGGGRDFTRAALGKIMALARLMFLKNPIIKRGVLVQADYVWALGWSVRGRTPEIDQIVSDFMDDPQNRKVLTGQAALIRNEVELQVLGNRFIVLFPSAKTGHVKLGLVPPEEIVDIFYDPDNMMKPLYYLREWTPRPAATANPAITAAPSAVQRAWHPDWQNDPQLAATDDQSVAGEVDRPTARPETLGEVPIRWNAPVYHIKDGAFSDMRFGVPDIYAAMDWARAYKEWLEDWATVMRALSRYAYTLTVAGGSSSVARAKSRLASTVTTASPVEGNPSGPAGATFLQGTGVKLDPLKTSGVSVSPDEGRRLLLMACAALGKPETFFGDATAGTLATAKSLDRPTELRFKNRQSLWLDVIVDLIDYALTWAVRSSSGRIAGDLVAGPDGTMRADIKIQEADKPVIDKAIKSGRRAAGRSPYVEASFPDIIERDVDAAVRAIIAAGTLDGQQLAGTIGIRPLARMLLVVLGVPEPDELLVQMGLTEDDDIAVQPPDPIEVAQATAALNPPAADGPAGAPGKPKAVGRPASIMPNDRLERRRGERQRARGAEA